MEKVINQKMKKKKTIFQKYYDFDGNTSEFFNNVYIIEKYPANDKNVKEIIEFLKKVEISVFYFKKLLKILCLYSNFYRKPIMFKSKQKFLCGDLLDVVINSRGILLSYDFVNNPKLPLLCRKKKCEVCIQDRVFEEIPENAIL